MSKFLSNEIISEKETNGFIRCKNFPHLLEHTRAYNNYLVKFLFRFPTKHCYHDNGFWGFCCDSMDKFSSGIIHKNGELEFKGIIFKYDTFTDALTGQEIFAFIAKRLIGNKFSKKELEEIELEYGIEALLKKRDRCICNGMKENHYDD